MTLTGRRNRDLATCWSYQLTASKHIYSYVLLLTVRTVSASFPSATLLSRKLASCGALLSPHTPLRLISPCLFEAISWDSWNPLYVCVPLQIWSTKPSPAMNNWSVESRAHGGLYAGRQLLQQEGSLQFVLGGSRGARKWSPVKWKMSPLSAGIDLHWPDGSKARLGEVSHIMPKKLLVAWIAARSYTSAPWNFKQAVKPGLMKTVPYTGGKANVKRSELLSGRLHRVGADWCQGHWDQLWADGDKLVSAYY